MAENKDKKKNTGIKVYIVLIIMLLLFEIIICMMGPYIFDRLTYELAMRVAGLFQ